MNKFYYSYGGGAHPSLIYEKTQHKYQIAPAIRIGTIMYEKIPFGVGFGLIIGAQFEISLMWKNFSVGNLPNLIMIEPKPSTELNGL